jgi:hypothetical protein
MPADSREQDATIGITLRMLGEYSQKVSRGLRQRSTSLLLLWLASIGFVVSALLPALLPVVPDAVEWPISLFGRELSPWIAVVGMTVFGFFSGRASITWHRDRPELQLAVRQLRKIYELTSRLEDVADENDVAHRLEVELRLSEAQFLLNRADRANLDGVQAPAEVAKTLRKSIRPDAATRRAAVVGQNANTKSSDDPAGGVTEPV